MNSEVLHSFQSHLSMDCLFQSQRHMSSPAVHLTLARLAKQVYSELLERHPSLFVMLRSLMLTMNCLAVSLRLLSARYVCPVRLRRCIAEFQHPSASVLMKRWLSQRFPRWVLSSSFVYVWRTGRHPHHNIRSLKTLLLSLATGYLQYLCIFV